MKLLSVNIASFIVIPPCRLRDTWGNVNSERGTPFLTVPVKSASATGHSNCGGEKNDI